jgi:hypothetical protein
MKRSLTVLAAAVSVLLGTLVVAPPASADFYFRWGETERTYSHYGNPALGQFTIRTWVDEWYRESDGAVFVRGHGRIVKVSKVLRTQVELVRLGRVAGGVLAENSTYANSGTALYAERVTAWVRVGDQFACADPSPLWNRTSGSARWADLTLSSKVSLLGDPTEIEYCYPPVAAAR